MQLSARAEYACLAMLELAVRHGDPKPIRVAEVADSHGIPQRFLVQILLQLKGAGLVTSTRGASGGYQLARSPDQISLADILNVIDRTEMAPDAPRPANRKDQNPSQLSGALRGVWDDISRSRQRILAGTTLASLVEAGQGLQYVI